MEKSLQIKRYLHGENEDAIGNIYKTIGIIKMDKLQDFSGAIDALWKSLKIFTKLHGDNDFQVAVLFLKIGLAKMRLTSAREGRDELFKAREIGEKVYWENQTIKANFISETYLLLSIFEDFEENSYQSLIYDKKSI